MENLHSNLAPPSRTLPDCASYRLGDYFSACARREPPMSGCLTKKQPFDRGDGLLVHYGDDGDLGSAFDPPRRARSRTVQMQQDAVRIYGSPIVEAREKAGLLHTLHVGAHVIYGNTKATDPRRLALFGDSFSHVIDRKSVV